MTRKKSSSLFLWLESVCSLLGYIALILYPSSLASAVQAKTDAYTFFDASECGVWLAPSSIEGAGMGTYAGRNFQRDEHLQEVGDLVIPLVDITKHARSYSPTPWYNMMGDYTWSGPSINVYSSKPGEDVQAASMGVGSAINCVFDLNNVVEGSPVHDTAGLTRYTSPGIGAFTPYYDRRVTATRDISKGSELFASYGSHWFRHRPGMATVPLEGDLERGTSLARSWHVLVDSVLPVVANDAIHPVQVAWDQFVRQSRWKNESRVIGAFRHGNQSELNMLKNNSLYDLRLQDHTRSVEWLKDNGICGDHMVPKNSTLPHAGRGAFAARDLPKGAIIAQIPLVHITDRNRLNMYKVKEDQCMTSHALFPVPKCVLGNPKKLVGHQLLMNYCYGNRASKILLCQYGIMSSFINHNSTRANVAIQWADPARSNHMPSLLNVSLEELEKVRSSKLAFELVTLRNIEKGEEIFLDYGSDWERAWLEYIAGWETPSKAENDETRPLTVFQQLNGSSYEIKTEVLCDQSQANRKNLPFLDRFLLAVFRMKDEPRWLPCDILRTTTNGAGDVFYTVVIFPTNSKQSTFHDQLPASAIKLKQHPSVNDLFFEKAFRHEIQIPDDIFPESWRNHV